MCVLVIFHVTKTVDLLVRTSIGNTNGVRCPLVRGFYNRDLNHKRSGHLQITVRYLEASVV